MPGNDDSASIRVTGLTYDEWAQSLAAFFFDEAHQGEEILFAVDELSLAEASGLSEGEASSSLAEAVRLVIGANWNVGVVKRTADRWRAVGLEGPHPALPFLSLTVLAASQMGSYEGFAPHKFYVPLRRALVPDDQEVDAPGTYLDYIRYFWTDLAQWANEDLGGRRGRLTIRDPGWQYGRGLAIQHALVKSSDLRQLDAFFRRIGLQPGKDVAPAELDVRSRSGLVGAPSPGRTDYIGSAPTTIWRSTQKPSSRAKLVGGTGVRVILELAGPSDASGSASPRRVAHTSGCSFSGTSGCQKRPRSRFPPASPSTSHA